LGNIFSIPSGFEVHIIYDAAFAFLGAEPEDILAHVLKSTYTRAFWAFLGIQQKQWEIY
jgi:hypothetical protein